MTRLDHAIPALPVRDAAAAVGFYRDRFGFEALHANGGFAVLRRDDVVLHVWESSDEAWRGAQRDEPVCSGAESFIAGTASCRISVDGDIHGLYDELRRSDVLHPVSADGVVETDFGSREFSTLDGDGNLVTFFQWVSA